MENIYYKQTDFGGTHHYLVSENSVTHVNFSSSGGYLINNLNYNKEGFEEVVLGAFGGDYEKISQEDFEAALKTAIFELNLYSYILTK